MIRYVFRDRPITIKGKADAQKIGEALDKIKRATPGRCNARTFLNAAHDKSNYLHRHLEWNDAIAGDKYRLQQIREIVACIDIVDTSDKKERQLPAFISLIEREGRGYHTAREVLDSATLQDIALRQAETDFLAYEKRLQQFSDICSAIKTARELIAEKREKYSKRKGKGKEDRPGA
jgi:hypothetical protein